MPDARPLPPDEDLYRSFRPKADHQGPGIPPEAIDLPATSCNRSSLANPESVLVSGRPDDTGIASVAASRLPAPTRSPDPKTETWYEFFGEYDPMPDNDAHSEIRLRRVGEPYDATHKPNSKPFKYQLRQALGERFAVLRRSA